MNKAFSGIVASMHALLDLVLPHYCIGCKKQGRILCDACTLSLRSGERPTEPYIFALFDYRDPIVKKAMWELKYHNKKEIGVIFGTILYETFMEEIADIYSFSSGRPISVIPVPMSDEKKRKRGYNQAEIIARAFCATRDSLALRTTIVHKNKETTPQAKIRNRTARLQNVHGVFEVLQQTDRGTTVIVIDDVTTTGGTFKEMRKVLKAAGATKVVCFAVAH